MSYQTGILIGLLLAGALNAFQPRALALVCIVFFYFFLLPKLLPAPNALGASWFIVLIALELSLGYISLATQTRAGIAVCGFSVWNCLADLFGYYAYTTDSTWYGYYATIVRTGEMSQIIALSLYSRPIIRLAVWWVICHKENDDGSHEFIGHRG